MAAYLIAICRSVTDPRRVADYFARVASTFASVDANPLSVYAPFEVLEATGPVEGVVLFEFPSVEAARNWYSSPAYQDVKRLREGAGEFDVMVVEGGWMVPNGRLPHVQD